MSTTGHESEAINVQGLKASLQKLKTNHIDGKAGKSTTLAGYGITDAYTKSETYTKTEVNGLVDTPHQEYVTVDAYANLPASGSKDTIYRVSNYNGSTSQVDASVYSEYAWDGTQYIFLCVKSQIGEVFDISVYNNNAKYADLAAALNGGANIPQSLQKGGMSVKFVRSSDNKYVQARCMAQDFTTDVTQWQVVDDEPTAGSKNLISSRGVYNKTSFLTNISYSERKEGYYMDAAGTEKQTSISCYLYIFPLSPNKRYALDSILKSFSGHGTWIGAALFVVENGADNLVKKLSSVPTASDTRFSCIIDTFGMTGVSKLKVCTTTSYIPVLNSVADSNGIMSGLVEPLTCSIEFDKAQRVNGQTDAMLKSRIFTYSIPQGRNILFLDAVSPNYSSLYNFVALYKDGVLVTNIKNCNGNDRPNGRILLNIGNVDANELKITSLDMPSVWTPFEGIDYSTISFSQITGTVSSAQLEGITLSDIGGTISLNKIDPNAILSTSGYYEVLTETLEENKVALLRDGTPQSNTNGCVLRHYTLSADYIYKIHFIKPNFTSYFIEGCLKKNGEIIKLFPRLNSTAAAVDKVLDNRQFEADELLLSISAGNKDYTIVSSSAVLIKPDTETEVLPSINNIITQPTAVHLLGQNSNKFGIIQRLYIEGISKDYTKSSLKLNGEQNVVIEHPDRVSEMSGSYTMSAVATADGYERNYCRVPIVKSNPNVLKNEALNVMCIGDSLTEGGYPGAVAFIGKCLNQDYCASGESIAFNMIGTRRAVPTITLGNYTFETRYCHQGKAGRAACDHLRHAYTVTINKTDWDLLGLGTMTRNGVATREYVALDNTDQTHLDLMSHTCHGWYDPENTQEVFTFLKVTCGITTFEYNGQSYTLGSTYSSDQYEVMKKAFEYFLHYGVSEFSLNNRCVLYDYDTVQSSNGAYALNLGAYLNRFKTLANDGTTRLMVGDTAGSLVTNINAYDVCLPTHVVLIMSENYVGRYGDTNVQDVVDDIEQIADLIYAYNSDIKIAIGCTRMYGAINVYTYKSYPGNFRQRAYLLGIWEEAKTRFANSNYAILPIYAIQTVFGTAGGFCFDACDLQVRQKMIGDYTHVGTLLGYLDRAYEVAAWVASTCSN